MIKYINNLFRRLTHVLFFVFLSTNIHGAENFQIKTADYRNFYGISWRGTPHENLLYARQMGYDYIFYQPGMEEDSLSNGMHFYIESPEYLIYNRSVFINHNYTNTEIDFYQKYCVLISKKSFPNNLATGWYPNDSTFTVLLNWQDQRVINWGVDEILLKVKKILIKNPKFLFGGFAWDVPQLSGDFWSNTISNGGRQVALNYWTGYDGTSFSYGSSNSLVSYSYGHFIFYKLLIEKSKAFYPQMKTIMEPYRIYEDWLSSIDKYTDFRKDFFPDILCQERKGEIVFNNSTNDYNTLISKSHLMNTSPAYFTDIECLQAAAKAAIVGSGFTWFGRFGGTGEVPNYDSIKEVPFRLKLIRMLTGWENGNKTKLKDRHWDGKNYTSPNATINKDIIAIHQPKTKKIFIVFLSDTGQYKIPKNSAVISAFYTDPLFVEQDDALFDLEIRSKSVYLTNAKPINKGIVLTIK